MKYLWLFASLSVLLFAQCKKDEKDENLTYRGQFYTYSEQSNEALELTLNDSSYGKLPVFNKPLQCFTKNDSQQRPLYIELKEGKYIVTGKDSNGVIKSQGWFILKENSVTSSSETGNIFADGDCMCLQIGLQKSK